MNHPPLMSDGRFLSYHGSSNELAEQLRKTNGINNPNQFRSFLQNNAEKLMNQERKYLDEKYHMEPKIACSDGWRDMWQKYHGNWGALGI